MVWKMIFLFNWVVFRFHVNLAGSTTTQLFPRLQTAFSFSYFPLSYYLLHSSISGGAAGPPWTRGVASRLGQFQGTQNGGTKYLCLGCFGGGVPLHKPCPYSLHRWVYFRYLNILVNGWYLCWTYIGKYASPMDPLGASVHGSLGRRKNYSAS